MLFLDQLTANAPVNHSIDEETGEVQCFPSMKSKMIEEVSRPINYELQSKPTPIQMQAASEYLRQLSLTNQTKSDSDTYVLILWLR